MPCCKLLPSRTGGGLFKGSLPGFDHCRISKAAIHFFFFLFFLSLRILNYRKLIFFFRVKSHVCACCHLIIDDRFVTEVKDGFTSSSRSWFYPLDKNDLVKRIISVTSSRHYDNQHVFPV